MLKFAVIGHPIGHSLSPAIHAANFHALGIDATYEAFDFAPEELSSGVARLVLEGYSGFNVTVPHKQAMINLVTLDESAARYLAVNTVKIGSGGMMRGYNTDVAGFLDDLEANGFNVRGKQVLVMGATSLGLRPDDPAPISAAFSAKQVVYDLAPVKWTTALVKAARESGAKALTGHGMLVRQAARAFEIWTGKKADVDAMFAALEKFQG